MAKILVTGGLGYIGSHTVLELYEAGFEPVIVDNLSNSSPKVLERLEKLSGQTVTFENADVRDTEQLQAIIAEHQPKAVIHFAALKSVNESVDQPIEYYENNVVGTLSLLKAMRACNLKRLIFSSSAIVYGDIDRPATEDMPVGVTTNPYGATKVMCERILQDVSAAEPDWSITMLRYFNPIGAHPSGEIGESPNETPNNLFPYITQVAVGTLAELQVFGNDYQTPDGTCIRDFIHVVDLARGHVAALRSDQAGAAIYNLGTGTGSSVLEAIQTFEKATGQKVPYKIVGRRVGDLPNVIADPSKAKTELGWQTELDLAAMCHDAWNWQSKNPTGY